MGSNVASKIVSTIFSLVMMALFWTVAADWMTESNTVKFISGVILMVVGLFLEGTFIYKLWKR